MNPSRLTAVAVATLAAACALAAPASSATNGTRACTTAGYSYAGIETLAPARGLSTRLTVSRAARVTSGHVAAWIGVGGGDAWLQIGVSAVGDGTMELYYEVMTPGTPTAYTSLGAVAAGDSHLLTVLETAPDTWALRLDGAAVSPAFSFPGSHGTWSPTATTESYDGGLTGCNAYGFQFSDLKSSPALQVWQPLGRVRSFHDAGHTLTAPAPGTIVVSRR
jgi:hypothetical protein